MSDRDPDLSPLPEDLADFLTPERQIPELEGDVADSLWDRVEQVTTPTGGITLSMATLGALGVGLFAAGLLVGVWFAPSFGQQEVMVTEAPVPELLVEDAQAVAPPPLEPAGSEEPVEAPSLEPTRETFAAGTTRRDRTRPAESTAPAQTDDPTSSLSREREMLDVARAAIVRRRPTDALQTLRRHLTTFPEGHLAEERESLRIQALVLAGERARAEQLAETFRARYPSSIYLNAITQSLERP